MDVVRTTSLSLPELAPYAHLTEAQLRNRLHPDEGLFVCESLKVIRVALQCGVKPVSLLAEEKFIDSQVQPLFDEGLCPEATPVYTAPREVLAGLTGYELSRGILCAMQRPAPRTASEVCRGARRVAVLDSVVNSTNTGAIFRAAAALGIDAALLTDTCCDPLNRRACRVSMGTVFQLPWAYLDNGPYIQQLKQLGLATVALALSDNSVPLSDVALKTIPSMAIILGTEGTGIDNSTLAQCDHVVRIPMQRGVDSLNVAAAAAVAFYELNKQAL